MLIDRCLFFCVCVFISASSNSGYHYASAGRKFRAEGLYSNCASSHNWWVIKEQTLSDEWKTGVYSINQSWWLL